MYYLFTWAALFRVCLCSTNFSTTSIISIRPLSFIIQISTVVLSITNCNPPSRCHKDFIFFWFVSMCPQSCISRHTTLTKTKKWIHGKFEMIIRSWIIFFCKYINTQRFFCGILFLRYVQKILNNFTWL